MKRRRALKVLSVSATLVLGLGWFEASRLGLTSAHERYIAEVAAAKKAGLPFTKEEIGMPSVPDDENAAQILINARLAAKSLPGHPETVLEESRESYSKVHPTDAQVDRALTDLQPVFEMADAAAKRPHLDFHWLWKSTDDEMDGPSETMALVKLLTARSDRAGQKADLRTAFASLHTAAVLSGQLAAIPDLLAIYVRTSCELLLYNGASNLLRKDHSPETIAALRKVLAELRDPPDLRQEFRARFVLYQGGIGKMAFADEHESCGRYDCDYVPIVWRLMRIPQIADANRAAHIALCRRMYAALPADINLLNRAQTSVKNIEEEGSRESGLDHIATQAFLPECAHDIDRILETVARRRVLSAALDILSEADPPATWSKSGYDWLDPFTDRPLTYRRTKDGFVVYSFGKDRKDDGGRPVAFTSDYNEFDISFEYPKLAISPPPKPIPPGPPGASSGD